jgi:hypothetical protein
MERTMAAMVALKVTIGLWQVSAITSISRDLPERLTAEMAASRGACSHAG